jgi:hypothetical protein
MPPALVSYPYANVVPGYYPTGDERTSRWPGGPDFVAEYARSDRSTCRLCRKPIAQDEVRLAMNVVNFASESYKCTFWHHYDCFFTIEDALHLVDPHRQLRGLNTLSADDRHRLESKIAAFQTMYAATKVALAPKFARIRRIAETGESDDDSDEAIVSKDKRTRQPAPAKVAARTPVTKAASKRAVPKAAKTSKAKATNPAAAKQTATKKATVKKTAAKKAVRKAAPRAVKTNSKSRLPPATTAARRTSRTTVGKKKAARK